MNKRFLLVLDQWHNVSGGASKAALYGELSKHYDLIFVKVGLPKRVDFLSYVTTFHPDIFKWKQRRGRFMETVQKRPEIFQLLTRVYSQAVKKVSGPYDAILQIGSLFGPAENPRGVPYFSYSDSTVRNPDKMWPDWMPDDFGRFRNKWYALERKYFESLTGSMFYSQWAADTLVNEYGIDRSKVHVVGSALKMPQDYDIDWTRRKKQVVFVSTDFKRKGGYELPGIFEKVVEAIPDARLVIVGNVPSDFDFRAPWLELKGAVSRDELVEIYKESSVLVHPAKYDPFPSIILEAANFEIPAVASNICGIPEMIKDVETGFVVEVNDHQTFVDCLVDLLRHNEHCRAMGTAAKKYVREHYSPDRIAFNIQKVISYNG